MFRPINEPAPFDPFVAGASSAYSVYSAAHGEQPKQGQPLTYPALGQYGSMGYGPTIIYAGPPAVALGQTTAASTGKWIAFGLIAAAGVYAYVNRDKLKGIVGAEDEDEAGYYVLLYPDEDHSRLKGHAGRYDTLAEAEKVADDEGDVWFTEVRYLEKDPIPV